MKAVALILLAATSASADWWEVRREVAARLVDKDVGDWARELAAQPVPSDEHGLMLRFQVLLRAGHLDRLPAVIDPLAALPCDEPIRDLIERGCLDLARRALERCDRVGRDTIERFLRTCDDGIEPWLAARVARNESVWFEPWFSFRARRGTSGPLLEQVAQGVRGQPSDMRIVKRYLCARHEAKAEDDPSWLADVVRLRLASESAEIAGWLEGPHPKLAARFLERSLAQPFTEEDERRLRMWLSMPPPESMEPRFRDGTKAALARAYQRTGDVAKAQALMEDLAARYPDGLPPDLSGLAGQVQRDSGARVIEGRIRGKEPERKEDAGYWLSRAQYFAGRKEDAEARAAFEKALELAPPSHERSRILDAFARYLFDTARAREAEALLDRSFTEAEPGSDYAYSRLTRLLHHGNHRSAFPRPDDERLWRYLAARPVWHDERWLLERMARRAADRPALWRRATALTSDADPSRAVMLADAMMRLGDFRDAIPLLRGALPRLDRPDQAENLLFDALVRENDWRGAEAMACADASRLGRAAVAAAKAGDRKEALRLWARRTSLDRLSWDCVAEIVEAVGRAAVAASYAAISMRDREFRMTPSLTERLDS